MASVSDVSRLDCGICEERFDAKKHQPKIFSCGHTFCKACIEGLPKKVHSLSTVICPDCRADVNPTTATVNYCIIGLASDGTSEQAASIQKAAIATGLGSTVTLGGETVTKGGEVEEHASSSSSSAATSYKIDFNPPVNISEFIDAQSSFGAKFPAKTIRTIKSLEFREDIIVMTTDTTHLVYRIPSNLVEAYKRKQHTAARQEVADAIVKHCLGQPNQFQIIVKANKNHPRDDIFKHQLELLRLELNNPKSSFEDMLEFVSFDDPNMVTYVGVTHEKPTPKTTPQLNYILCPSLLQRLLGKLSL